MQDCIAYRNVRNPTSLVPPTGLDYDVTSLNVTMEAGYVRTMFIVRIFDDPVVERRESFRCSVSKINTPSQNIPIEWDQVPATVIIEDDDYSVLEFLVHDYYQVYENVSSISVGIRSSRNASFEYTVDLIKGESETAKGILLCIHVITMLQIDIVEMLLFLPILSCVHVHALMYPGVCYHFKSPPLV